MATLDLDVAVVGHFSIDSLRLPSRAEPYQIMGGAVAYASIVVRRLGGSVAIISKIGADFPDAYLQQLNDEGVDTSKIIRAAGEPTTSFELTYGADLASRALRLRRQGSPIMLSDLPDSLHAKAIHIAPIAAEISYDVVKRLRGCCDFLSIDPQGMTRSFDAEGNVTCNVEVDKRVLGLVDVYKSSFEEIVILTGQSSLEDAIKHAHMLGPKTVIVTMGPKGSVLSAQGKITNIPTYRSTKAIDPTGAGDVFIGALLTEYIKQKTDLLWCACVGSAAASLVVEGVGTSFFGEKEEIYRRAHSLYK